MGIDLKFPMYSYLDDSDAEAIIVLGVPERRHSRILLAWLTLFV